MAKDLFRLVELPARRRHAVLVSASLVSRRGEALSADLRRALDEALSPLEVCELILQSLLFDGYPCALEGFIALREILGPPSRSKASQENYTPENVALWRERGLALCSQIYESNFTALLRHVELLSPTLKEWMLVEGYGRVLSRPALDLDLRELGIVAILTVKNRPRQLQSHLRGALHVGVSPTELHSAIHLCMAYGKAVVVRTAMRVCRTLVRKSV